MGGYIVLSFFAAQFINYFAWSNLGAMLAVSGARLLIAQFENQRVRLTGIALCGDVQANLSVQRISYDVLHKIQAKVQVGSVAPVHHLFHKEPDQAREHLKKAGEIDPRGEFGELARSLMSYLESRSKP